MLAIYPSTSYVNKRKLYVELNNLNLFKFRLLMFYRRLWNLYLKECKDCLENVEFDCIIKKVYDNFDVSVSKTDSESSSPGSIEILTEMIGSSIDPDVVSYDQSSIDD